MVGFREERHTHHPFPQGARELCIEYVPKWGLDPTSGWVFLLASF